MTEGLSRKAAAEFFFLAVPTMLAVTVYSVFVKTWGKGTAVEMKGYEMILQDENHIHLFIIGNIAFVLLLHFAVKTLSVSLQNTVSNFGVIIIVSHTKSILY
jgi:undecaprenyl-diphosphatase